MNTFQADRETVAGKLAAAGVDTVSLDRGQAPPFVLVGVPSGSGKGSVGQWETVLPITIVGNAPGDTENATWMLDQLEVVLTTLGIAAWRPSTYGDEELPALTVTYTRNVPNPNC